MATSQELTPSRRGAWIINASKHLLRFDSTLPGLTALENILFAGRCGSLLIKLSGDETDQLTLAKVKAHARLCGIGALEMPLYLHTLQGFGCLDHDKAGGTFEVLAY